ncbi:xaa-Arg dipeptidase-like [Diadema setosum]|uniref:xaa-Arg dipeptidase-like n=1 Tax=Diadema setosum TaxID=31175 RepID=UPI003B3B3A68
MDLDWSKKEEEAQRKIDAAASDLNILSQEIWLHPELNFEERHAHKVLTNFLEKEGFQVTRNFHLETAFKATYGSDTGVHVCVICEYDALPEIGHACGHNLIAECGAAAGLGIKAALEMDETPVGRVTVLGTPAEEGGGGKKDLIKAGVFQDIDVAMMAHPFQHNISRPIVLSLVEVAIHFTGHAAHAAASPWLGQNALDAAVMCYNSISVMRQQFKPEWRVHGIFSNGGAKPNIIPEEAELLYYIRAPNERELAVLKEKVLGCARGAAVSTGCEVDFKYHCSYANLVSNPTLASIYEQKAEALGVELVEPLSAGSTDMGDTSYVVPSIHPMYYIGTMEPNHSRAFTQSTGAPKAQAPTLVQAKALALTALELLRPGNQHLMEQIRQDFRTQMEQEDPKALVH